MRASDKIGFKCSKPEFEEYLPIQAMYDQTEQVGQPYIFDCEKQVVGYVVLSMDRLDEKRTDIGVESFGSIPALLIGYLATDIRYERRGVGRLMVNWAIKYARTLSSVVGCRAVLVSAEPDVVGFYERLGFAKIEKKSRTRSSVDMYVDIKRT